MRCRILHYDHLGTYSAYMGTTDMGMGRAIADEIESRRTAAGKSILELSEETGIPRTTLMRRLKDGSQLEVNELSSIAKHLGTTLLDIVDSAESRRAKAIA